MGLATMVLVGVHNSCLLIVTGAWNDIDCRVTGRWIPKHDSWRRRGKWHHGGVHAINVSAWSIAVDITLHTRISNEQIPSPAPEPGEPGVTDAAWDLIRRLPKYARVAASMVADERVPLTAKGMLVAAGAYLVSPIDAIPGIIPVAGQLDDLYVVLTGLQLAVRVSPPEVAREHFSAVGLEPAIVDDDLASIRRFVRQGVRWTLKRSGDLMSSASRQMSALATRLGQRGGIHDDQEPRKQGPAATEPRAVPEPGSNN